MPKCLRSQTLPLGQCESTLDKRLTNVWVSIRRDDHSHIGMILGSGTHHGRATDIDLLDALDSRCPRSNGLREGVEIDDDKFERGDAKLRELLDMIREPNVRKHPGVNPRMKSLD